MGVHVLGSKNWGRKGLIFYETQNGALTMKKIMKLNILTLLKCTLMKLCNDILLKQMLLWNKVQKVTTLGSIFFNSTTTH